MTRQTNCILIQHQVLSQNIGRPKGNYEFDRKKHSSFKILLTELARIFFKKAPCKKFYFNTSSALMEGNHRTFS